MPTTLTIDLFVSADGWAGSEDLPGYFGYLGPDLEGWIAEETAATQVALMGRATYELLSGIPDEAKDEATAIEAPVRAEEALGRSRARVMGRVASDSEVPRAAGPRNAVDTRRRRVSVRPWRGRTAVPALSPNGRHARPGFAM